MKRLATLRELVHSATHESCHWAGARGLKLPVQYIEINARDDAGLCSVRVDDPLESVIVYLAGAVGAARYLGAEVLDDDDWIDASTPAERDAVIAAQRAAQFLNDPIAARYAPVRSEASLARLVRGGISPTEPGVDGLLARARDALGVFFDDDRVAAAVSDMARALVLRQRVDAAIEGAPWARHRPSGEPLRRFLRAEREARRRLIC